MLQVTANVLYGYNCGFTYGEFKKREDEAKGKGNDTVAALTHYTQYSFVTLFFNDAIDKMQRASSLPRSIGAVVISALALPCGLFAAAIKQKTYEKWIQNLDERGSRWAFILPRNFSERSIRALSFYSDHIGNCLEVAVIVGALALIALGSRCFGGGILIACAYRQLDLHGTIPSPVRLFMDTLVPFASVIATIFVGGSFSTQIWGVFQLATLIPPINRQINYVEKGLVRYFVPTLANREQKLPPISPRYKSI